MCLFPIFKPVFIYKLIISTNRISTPAVETITNSVQHEINKSCLQYGEIQGQGLFVLEMRQNTDFPVEMNISVYIVQTRNSLPITN